MILRHTAFPLQYTDEDENTNIEQVAVARAREQLGQGHLSVRIIDHGRGYMVYAAIVA